MYYLGLLNFNQKHRLHQESTVKANLKLTIGKSYLVFSVEQEMETNVPKTCMSR